MSERTDIQEILRESSGMSSLISLLKERLREAERKKDERSKGAAEAYEEAIRLANKFW